MGALDRKTKDNPFLLVVSAALKPQTLETKEKKTVFLFSVVGFVAFIPMSKHSDSHQSSLVTRMPTPKPRKVHKAIVTCQFCSQDTVKSSSVSPGWETGAGAMLLAGHLLSAAGSALGPLMTPDSKAYCISSSSPGLCYGGF